MKLVAEVEEKAGRLTSETTGGSKGKVMAAWLRAGQESFMTVRESGASQRRRKTAESIVGFAVPK